MHRLTEQKKKQQEMSEKAGSAWNNEWNLVFTNELGEHLKQNAIYKAYKRVVRKIGIQHRDHCTLHRILQQQLVSSEQPLQLHK